MINSFSIMLKYINHVGGGYRMSGFANAYAYQLLWMKFGLNIWFELASSEAFSYHTVWCYLPCVPYVSWMYIKSYMCNCSVQLRLTRRQIALIWYGCFDDLIFFCMQFFRHYDSRHFNTAVLCKLHIKPFSFYARKWYDDSVYQY